MDGGNRRCTSWLGVMAGRNHVVLGSEEDEPAAPAVTSSPTPTQPTPPVVTLTEAEERTQQDAFSWWKREIDRRLKEFYMTPTEEKMNSLLVQVLQYRANFNTGGIKPPRFST